MSDHPINGLMDTTIKKIKEMVDVNTIIGDPITTPDGTTVIPVSKVTYGFASGGSDLPTKKENKDCFGGGSGAGVTIQPIGFLTISKGNVKLVPIESYNGAIDRIAGIVPDVVDKVTDLIAGNKKSDEIVDIDKELDSFGKGNR